MFKMLISPRVLHYTTYYTLLYSPRGVHSTIMVTFRVFLCFGTTTALQMYPDTCEGFLTNLASKRQTPLFPF
ncbi:hypothetical protein GDO81_023690 [Engystomops pustulosus]|uniref:Secreted protein n=1 Tax=Engystomops pustulosus TaxID=76066 RepID=A0AAV6YRK0_ENGPU|nr:hypothetical protein GDO81_023690 [Engystomops pustulosus]